MQADLAALVPQHKVLPTPAGNTLVLPHTSEVTRLARNLGVNLPAPVLYHYDWPGRTPFEVQRQTVAMMTTNNRAFVLNGMGTGKTACAIWAWDSLYEEGSAKRLLVVAPLSTLRFTWQREFFQLVPGRRVAVLHGTKARRMELLADKSYDVFVINHDGLSIIKDHLPPDIDALVLDELSVFRNNQAQRTKIAAAVAARMKWVWGMTGSPIPNEPTDAYAQCRIVNPDRVPKFFGRFRDQVMLKVSQFQFKPKDGALDVVYGAMQPSVRFTLDDVTELPDLIERTIDVEMGTKQAKLYDAMAKKAHALIDSHEITAMNAGVVLMKLLQIACGYVYTSEKETVPLDNDKRIEALLDIMKASDQKVLVFVPFKHAMDGVSKAFTSEGIEHAVISGDVAAWARGDIFNAFQQTNKYKAIVAHPATMSHGLTLTAASTIVWFAPITSLETFEQANARIRRVGQRHKQQVIMLQSTAVEKKIYKKLRQKQSVQNRLLEMFTGED